MSINEKQRVIDVNCTNYNTDTFFLGYANDVDCTVLRFTIDPKYLVNGLSYRLVFDREDGSTPVTCSPIKDITTQEITQTVPTNVTHGSGTNNGYTGRFQFFVMEGNNDNDPVTFLYSSAKFTYIIKDSLEITEISQEDVPSTLWDDLSQAVSFINSLDLDTQTLSDDNDKIPTSYVVNSALNAANIDKLFIRQHGNLSSTTALNNSDYCVLGGVHQFIADDYLADDIGLDTDTACELRFINSYQIITVTETQQVFARKVNRIAPIFNADVWAEVVNPRITTLESANTILENAISGVS